MLLSTDRVRPNQRARFWRDVCNGIIELDCRIDGAGEAFSGSVEFTALGNTPAFLVSMEACMVERSARHIATALDPPVLLIHERAGRVRYEGDGREITYGYGQFILIDTAIPYQARIGARCRGIIMAVDRRALTLRLGDYRPHLGRPVSANDPFGALACAMLAVLPRSIHHLDPVSGVALESQVLDLVAMALSRGGGTGREAPIAESGPLIRLNAAVEAAVADAALRPEDVAAAAGMTIQEANLLLRRERATLAEVMTGRRLDRSRERIALASADPAALIQIASDAGFDNALVFRHAYRDRFGEDPD